MKKYFGLFILLNSCVGFLYSQNINEIELRKGLLFDSDLVKINSYIELAEYYNITQGKGDSAIAYGNKIIMLSTAINNTEYLVKGYSTLGLGLATNKDYKTAKDVLIKGLNIAKQKNSSNYLAEINNRVAGVYDNLGERSKAITHALQAIELAKQNKNYNVLALSYYCISVIYAKEKQTEKQLEYLLNAIQVVSTVDDISAFSKSIILGSASQQFSNISTQEGYENFKDSSFVYAQKALENSKLNNLVQRIPSDLIGLSLKYANQGKYDESLTYLDEALQYTNIMREDTKLNLFQILSYVYRAKANKEASYIYLDSLNNLQIKQKPHYGAIISKFRHTTYKYFDDHNLAYKALDEYFEFENKKKQEAQNKTINELEAKYQTQLKENRIKKLTNWLIISLSIGLLAFLFFYINRLKESRKKNNLLKEAIKQQIAFEKELVNVRNNIAQDFHDDLGNKLARISFLSRLVEDELSEKDGNLKSKVTQVKEDTVSLYVGTKDFIFSLKPNSDYLEEVVTYLSDFGQDYFDKTEIKFVLDKDISLNQKLPHYWSKQLIYIFKEAMTNAFKHSKCNELILKFEQLENQLTIKCVDNGIGINPNDLDSKSGLFNMKSRAKKIDGNLEVITSKKGTTIVFTGEII